MSQRYCNSPTAYSVFGPWCACGSDGTCSVGDRSRCDATFNKIYNPNGTPEHPIEPDPSTRRFGGAEERECRFAGSLATFLCLYVDPGKAEGYTGEADGSPYGWISYPDSSSAPLSKPFYVFREIAGVVSYEWRYWMSADTGFGIDYAVRRTFGANSRNGMHWIANVDETGQALCDVTTSRGNCSLSCTASSDSPTGLALGAVCQPPAPPDIATNAATNITQTSAALNLTVNPNGTTTFVWFDWDSSANLGQGTAPHQNVGGGTTNAPIRLTLNQLTCKASVKRWV
jgi:hypothetical protein